MRLTAYEIKFVSLRINYPDMNNQNLLGKSRRCLTTVLFSVALAGAVFALDLPTKEINGKAYYYYKVKKGETVYSLTHRFGVTYDAMVKNNPWVSEGLKFGKTLYFPVEDFSTVESRKNTSEHKVKRGETLYSLANQYGVSMESIVRLNPGVENGLKKNEIIVIPADDSVQPVVEAVEEVATEESADGLRAADVVYESDEEQVSNEISVALMLPFMLDEAKPGKMATYATDFYRGFLLGIDSLRSVYGNPEINITTIDAENDNDFQALTKNAASLRMADLIIAPDNAEQLTLLNRFGEQNQIYILNNFQARDTAAKTNPYALQSNILQNEMFAKVADYFISYLENATPVFIENTSGTQDKEAFVSLLKDTLTKNGIVYKTISFKGNLNPADVSDALPLNDGDYVFIPQSGSLSEFNKFAPALKKFQKEASEYSTPVSIRLFGYPEYTRFSNDALDDLSRLNTTFYSRFYNDNSLNQNDKLNADFEKWYGTPLPDGVPNQALYGFDAARLVLAFASKGELTPETITNTRILDPSQQAYIFKQVPDGGFINDALFFVTIGPGMYVKTELK